jgi:hypothetical protein
MNINPRLIAAALVAVCCIANMPLGAQEPIPLDPEPRLTYKYGVNMRFGVSIIKDQAGKPVNKQLTYSNDGGSNTTVVRIDGKDAEFGGAQGKWIDKEMKLPADAARNARDITRSTWETPGGLRFTQVIEVVASKQPVDVAPGVQKRVYDTCMIYYVIENLDKKPRSAGLRLQLDTLIGANDGVPFAVPGVQGLVNTKRDFPTAKEVPDFAQALEMPDLKKPGTIGHLTFKVGGSLEAPSRISLTRWPGFNVATWEIPVADMGTDSAVVMYWNERELQPNESRKVGFAYGLGTVSSSEGKIGISVSGAFEVGQPFTVSAYVSNPIKGETVTLTLPEGIERVQGQATETVPPVAEKGNSIVTWQVKAARKGQFPIQVQSSEGGKAAKTVTIADAPPVAAGAVAKGKVIFLLVQETGEKFGPQQLGAEVIFRLDTEPDRLFSFPLRERAHQAMLEMLRDAFNAERVVSVNARSGAENTVFRVWVEKAPTPVRPGS